MLGWRMVASGECTPGCGPPASGEGLGPRTVALGSPAAVATTLTAGTRVRGAGPGVGVRVGSPSPPATGDTVAHTPLRDTPRPPSAPPAPHRPSPPSRRGAPRER